MGRRFHSETVGRRTSGRGHGVGSALGAVFVLPWSLGQSGRNSSREECVPFRESVGVRVEEDMVLGLLLVQSLCSPGATVSGRNSSREECV